MCAATRNATRIAPRMSVCVSRTPSYEMRLALLALLAASSASAASLSDLIYVVRINTAIDAGPMLAQASAFWRRETGIAPRFRLVPRTLRLSFPCDVSGATHDPLQDAPAAYAFARARTVGAIIMLVPPCRSIGYAGLTEQGGWRSYVRTDSGPTTLAHEMGHLFGLKHSGWGTDPRGNPLSIMGSAPSLAARLTPWERWTMGLPLASGQVRVNATVFTDGNATYLTENRIA
jgi:hypothetical protein